jgi:hypothetical protein
MQMLGRLGKTALVCHGDKGPQMPDREIICHYQLIYKILAFE